MDRLADRYGATAIILSRPLPLLAEATVLVLGTTSLAWRRFLPTLMLSNLGLGFGYALVGYIGQRHGQLVWALVASVAVPAISTGVARMMWRPKNILDDASLSSDTSLVEFPRIEV
jgi:membrane protein DedA with SNARE-associated domain